MPDSNRFENNEDESHLLQIFLLQLFFLLKRKNIIDSITLLVKAIIAIPQGRSLETSSIDTQWLNQTVERFIDAAPFVNSPNGIAYLSRAIAERANSSTPKEISDFTEEDVRAVVIAFLRYLGINAAMEG